MDLNKFTFQPIDSTRIKTFGYIPKSDRYLTSVIVEFQRGGIYLYRDIPIQVIEDILNAESKGKMFQSYIKWFSQYEKLEDVKLPL